jgi:minor extracellular serine protease Vpr
VPRARSIIRMTEPSGFGPSRPKGTVKVRNDSTEVGGTADFYAWGLSGTNKAAGEVGLKAVGVQANPYNGDAILFFAINTFKAWSNNSENEFDILIDTNGDGTPDYALVAADQGSVTTGSPSGTMVTLLVDIAAGTTTIQYPVTTPTNGTTLLLPLLASDIGVTAASPRFSYSVNSYSASGATDTTGSAKFNAFNNAVTTASYVALPPGKHASVPLVIDPVEWAQTPALGVMIVGLENANGAQVRLSGIGHPSDNGTSP